MEMLKRVFDGEIKGIDEKERTLTAYVSTGARDRMDEVLDPAGVDMQKYKKNPIVLWAHDYHQPPIGKAMWIKKDGNGILSKMKFANTEFAQEIFDLYKDGFMNAFSVGFIPKEAIDGDGEKTPHRTFKRWELLEYSAVPVPANPEALALAVSKGILHDESLKSYFEMPLEDKIEAKDDEKPAEPAPEPKLDPTPETETRANPELLAEITSMSEEIERLRKVIQDLRFKLLDKNEVKGITLAGMTDGEILKKIEDTAIGVIRKITGKVS